MSVPVSVCPCVRQLQHKRVSQSYLDNNFLFLHVNNLEHAVSDRRIDILLLFLRTSHFFYINKMGPL